MQFCRWMEQPEQLEGSLDAVLCHSPPALKPVLRLLTSPDQDLAQRTLQFVKELLHKSDPGLAEGRDLRGWLVGLSLEAFAQHWHRHQVDATGVHDACLWLLLDTVVLCVQGCPVGLLASGEELQFFQKAMQLSLRSSEASQADTALGYFLATLRDANTDVDSAASLLLSSGRWLGWLELQLSTDATIPHAWPLLATLAQVQHRSQLRSERSVRVSKQSVLRELASANPSPALALLPLLLHGTTMVRLSPLCYADCSSLAYALATLCVTKRLQAATLECLEALLPHAELLADTEGCVSCLSSHPWLNQLLLVLLRGLHGDSALRLLSLLLQSDWVSEPLVRNLPFITTRLCQDGSSQAKAIAIQLLSGVYSSRLSPEVQGQLRQLLSGVSAAALPPANTTTA